MKHKFGLLIVILFISYFTSCKSDNDNINDAIKVVKNFVANMPLENYSVLYKDYPDLQRIRRYYIPTDVSIVDSSMDKNKTITILVTSTNIKSIMFTLKKVGDNYVIINSKGLAADFYTKLYNYCKNKSYINDTCYDVQVSQSCEKAENEFNEKVNKLKDYIEKSRTFDPHMSVSQYSHDVTGTITVWNKSGITLPARSYRVHYFLINTSNNTLISQEEPNNFSPFINDEPVTNSVYFSTTEYFDKVEVRLSILSTDFIEKIIADYAKNM